MTATPADYGLPYPSWYPNQLEAIEQVAASKKRFIVLELLCGGGKSGVAAALIHNDPSDKHSAILTHTKQLQEQYVTSFPSIGKVVGRNNFHCIVNESMNCAEGPCSAGWKCEYTWSCPYHQQKAAAAAKKASIHNFAYWVTEANNVGVFSKLNWLILDEAHLIEPGLRKHVSISLYQPVLHDLGVRPLHDEALVEEWAEWADDNSIAVGQQVQKLQVELEKYSIDDADPNKLREIARKRRTLEELIQLSKIDDSWLSEVSNHPRYGKRFNFRPALVNTLADRYIFRHADKILLMSGTILAIGPPCTSLGINQEEVDFIQMPQTFPIENRPVYYRPSVRVRKGMPESDLQTLVSDIDKSLFRYRGLKGLMHTASYNLAKDIIKRSKYSDRLVSHNTADRLEALEKFKLSSRDLVMTSPSMTEGVDLPEDLCLRGDTLVKTSLGYVPIAEIKTGDRVFTHNRKYRRVTAVNSRHYNGDIIELAITGNLSQYMTPEHPVLVDLWDSKITGRWSKSKEKKHTKLKWINAGELTTQMSLAYPVGLRKQKYKRIGKQWISGHTKTGSRIPNSWDESIDFWRLVGLWAAEGSLFSWTDTKRKLSRCGRHRKTWGIQFSFSEDERTTLAFETCNLVTKILGNKRPNIDVERQGGCTVRFKNNAFAAWLKTNVGCGAKNKYVPRRLLHCGNTDYMWAFILGWADGDGHKQSKFTTGATASHQLCLGIRDMLNCCGRLTHVWQRMGYFYIYWVNDDFYKGIKRHSFFVKNRRTSTPKFIVSKIKSVQRIPYSGLVYNLTVEKDESYTLEGCCVHNCRVVYFSKLPFPDLGDQQVKKRMELPDGKEWYYWTTSCTLVQASNRGLRSPTDKCVTEIFDKNWDWFKHAARKFIPKWFMAAVRNGGQETAEEALKRVLATR